MKNTGIVRRLDELGRIVIPREFRKTHRINVGDPLEISATEDGNIIISKVDNTSNLILLCETACLSLSTELNVTVAAANFDRFLACYGHGKQSIIDRELPSAISKLIKNRGFYNGSINADEVGKLPDLGFGYIAIAPILSLDDCFGGVFVLSDRPLAAPEIATLKLAGRLVGDALQRY